MHWTRWFSPGYARTRLTASTATPCISPPRSVWLRKQHTSSRRSTLPQMRVRSATRARYALEFLRGHLDKCQVYLSHRRLLIRPLIPPTLVHPAFDNPARRVYMSATPGAGGELERIFGRRKITRIPIPEGWEKQGTGRRLFCFPQLTSDLVSRVIIH
jgi:hypothetical protein